MKTGNSTYNLKPATKSNNWFKVVSVFVYPKTNICTEYINGLIFDLLFRGCGDLY